MDQKTETRDAHVAGKLRARFLTPPERQAMLRTVLTATDLALSGKVADAIRLMSGARDVRADPFGCTSLGSLFFQVGDVANALRCFDEALAIQPTYADALCNRGVALQKLRRPDEALRAYEAAASQEPGNVTAHFNRGNVLAMLGRFDEAEKAFSRALVLDPSLADAHVNRGRVELARRNPQAALADFEKALALQPDNADAANARLALFQQAGRPAPPLRPAHRVAPPPPGAAAALARSRVLIELGRYQDALALLPSAPPRGPIGAKLMVARSSALWRMGRHDDALAAGRAAIALNPADAEVHEEFSYLCFKVGDLARGWEEYEYRLARPHARMREAEQTAPVWRGEDLAGKHVRVLTEQGHGDTLQFARYLPLLHARGAELTVAVQPGILNLMRSMKTPATWVDSAAPSPRDDFHVHLMSLPHRFATRLDTIPHDVPYVFADAGKAEAWRSRIGEGGLRIGVVWQGNPNHASDHLRSIALASFAPLAAVPGVRLISLQALRGLDQLANLPAGMAVEDPGPLVTDNPDGMTEIAAVMANLDLIVTSDTSISHLAGALGRPVWVALHHDADWRWMRERSDSPWYPTMRLFRQGKPADWAGVFNEMAAELRNRAGAGPMLA